LQPLTTYSLSQRVRDILAGDLGAHRHLTVDRDKAAENAAPVPMVERQVYSRDDAQRAWAQRRANLEDIAVLAQNIDVTDKRKP
jgi:hypothetical protein